MADVVDPKLWNVVVADVKDLADKHGGAFRWERFPNGKEKAVVEIWYTPEKGMK